MRVCRFVDLAPFEVDVEPPVPPTLGALIPAQPWHAPFAPLMPARGAYTGATAARALGE